MTRLLTILFLVITINSINAQTFNGTAGSIPDNGASATCFPMTVSSLTTSINGSFGVATVCINITHTFDQDLKIYMTAPDGTRVPLTHRNGGVGDNFTNTCFSNTAATSIIAGSAPFT